MNDRDIERSLATAAKGILLGGIWMVCFYLLFRVVVPSLWGMPTDLAPILSLGSAILGVVGLIYLALLMVRSLRVAPPMDLKEKPPE